MSSGATVVALRSFLLRVDRIVLLHLYNILRKKWNLVGYYMI